MTRLSALLAASLALAACSTPVEIELPDHQPRLVVQGLFAADSVLTLAVQRSASVTDAPDVLEVTDATVEVYEDGTLVDVAEYVSNRLRYVTTVRPRAGRTYRVEVSAPGFEPVSAEDTVPEPVPFTVDVAPGPEPDTEGQSRVDAVTVRFADAPGDDFYALYGVVEQTFTDSDFRQAFPLVFRSNDPLLADGDLRGFISDFDEPFYQRAFFRSRPFDGQSVAIRINARRVGPEGTARVTERLRLATLSPTYYTYVRALTSDSDGSPFSASRDLPTNVTGGYGIFAAFSASEQVLPE